MMKSTFGLHSKTLVQLLRLGSAAEARHDHGQHDMLLHWLSEPLSSDIFKTVSWVRINDTHFLDQEGKAIPLGEYLGKETVPLKALNALKELYKYRVVTAKSESEKEVAKAIYYATIARALLLYRTCITRHSSWEVKKAMSHFARRPWIPSALKKLFEQALEDNPEDGPE